MGRPLPAAAMAATGPHHRPLSRGDVDPRPVRRTDMTPTRTAPRSFDHLPAVYDRYAELVGGPLRAHLTARLPERGRRAVDLGAGTGHHATLLAGHYEEVLAVDVSAPMLEFAQAKRPWPNVSYQCRDLREVTPARDGQFDLVFSAYALHHVDRI